MTMTMSDDEVVASDVPEGFLFVFSSVTALIHCSFLPPPLFRPSPSSFPLAESAVVRARKTGLVRDSRVVTPRMIYRLFHASSSCPCVLIPLSVFADPSIHLSMSANLPVCIHARVEVPVCVRMLLMCARLLSFVSAFLLLLLLPCSAPCARTYIRVSVSHSVSL